MSVRSWPGVIAPTLVAHNRDDQVIPAAGQELAASIPMGLLAPGPNA